MMVTARKARALFPEVMTFLLFLVFMVPFAMVVLNSAKTSAEIVKNPIGWPADWGKLFANIGTIVTSPNVNYVPSFVSSLVITSVSLLLIAVSASMAGWVLVRSKTALSTVIFMTFVAAMVIPFQVVMFPLVSWFRILSDVTGLKLLQSTGGMVLAYMGFGSSMSIFLFHGFIKGIPLELEEAAKIDGCSKAATFFLIVLPILKPIFVTVLILNGIWLWNDYLLPLLLLGMGGPVQTLPLAVANFVGSYVKKWDLILTATLMAMLPVIVLYLFAQKQIIQGITEGSIK